MLSDLISYICLNTAEAGDQKAHEHICMQKLLNFEGGDLFVLCMANGLTNHDFVMEDACTWANVMCENGLITEIDWRNGFLDYPDRQAEEIVHEFNLEWLPPTLTLVNLSEHPIGRLLNLALLPRGLDALDMGLCDLTGTLDLSQLPRTARLIKLKQNFFTGTVQLTDLPPTLQLLDLRSNELEALIYSHKRLPESLQGIEVHGNANMKVTLVDGKRDKRVAY